MPFNASETDSEHFLVKANYFQTETARPLDRLAWDAERRGPQLVRYSPVGERVDRLDVDLVVRRDPLVLALGVDARVTGPG